MPEKPLENLLTEQVNPASDGIDALPTGRILEIINAADRQVADAVARADGRIVLGGFRGARQGLLAARHDALHQFRRRAEGRRAFGGIQ